MAGKGELLAISVSLCAYVYINYYSLGNGWRFGGKVPLSETVTLGVQNTVPLILRRRGKAAGNIGGARPGII